MTNFYKYFPANEKVLPWGLNVLSVGCTRIAPESVYPDLNHPAHHYFTWENGRVLQEYSLVYIINGTGSLETDSVKKRILDGTVFMLHPNERHRFKPDRETGWDEYWVSFNGANINKLINNNLFSKKSPLFHLGLNERILQLFEDIVQASKEDDSSYQALTSTGVMHLLALTYGANQHQNRDVENLATITVKRAKVLLRAKVLEVTDSKSIAMELEVGYSWFRKIFKENTGISPGQYFIQLKIQKAKELLANPHYAVKEVAYMLKFESPFYFSKLFKQKTKLTPLQFRNMISGTYKL